MHREFKLRFYTGPVHVREIANLARNAGFPVSAEGTEHIHVWVPDLGDGWGAVGGEEKLALALHFPFPPDKTSEVLATRWVIKSEPCPDSTEREHVLRSDGTRACVPKAEEDPNP